MNNLENYDMLSRTLKEEKDTYNARFKETQDRKNEATALAYESLTAPFIEASGLNLLKKGGRTLGKSLNLTDEQIDNIGDIADNIKSGDIGGAINKVRNLGTKNILNEEQKNFLENLIYNNATRNAVPTGPSQRTLQRDVPTPQSPRGPAEPTGNQSGGAV